jgi:hypothetical protein
MSDCGKPPSTRIFGICASASPRVVLMRRGPTKHVLCVLWNTATHEFFAGQWFKGRIYEERCGLSPNGDKLVYLAANQKPPLYAWTAVSRPPFLTALVLWPNNGTWGGGGIWDTNRRLMLNMMGVPTLGKGFQKPPELDVRPIAPWAGRGEDDPISTMRMKRDGWVLSDEGAPNHVKIGVPWSWEYARPVCWRKSRGNFSLERRLLGVGEANGSWYVYEHRLLDVEGNLIQDYGRSDWADWSQAGEVLLTRNGKVHRVVVENKTGPAEPEALIDLAPLRFEPMLPPANATRWSGYLKGRQIK